MRIIYEDINYYCIEVIMFICNYIGGLEWFLEVLKVGVLMLYYFKVVFFGFF